MSHNEFVVCFKMQNLLLKIKKNNRLEDVFKA